MYYQYQSKLIILILLTLNLFVNGQINQLIIEPRTYDLREKYEIGQCSVTFNIVGMGEVCKLGSDSCSQSMMGVMRISDSQNDHTYSKSFNSQSVFAKDPQTITYMFDIYPNGISGNSSVSFFLFNNGMGATYLSNYSVSADDISVAGLNPFITVMQPQVQSTINSISFDHPVYDPSSGVPLVMSLVVQSHLPVTQVLVTFSDEMIDTIYMDIGSITKHVGQETTFQWAFGCTNTVFNASINSITLAIGDGQAFFSNLDLQALLVTTTFLVRPKASFPSAFPQLTSSVSSSNLTLSWDPAYQVYYEFTFGGASTAPIKGVFVNLNSLPAHRQMFPLSSVNPTVSFTKRVDTTQVKNLTCELLVFTMDGGFTTYECTTIQVLSPYPNDIVPPSITSYSLIGNNTSQVQLVLNLADADSGISKVSVFPQVQYDIDRVNGSINNPTYIFDLERYGPNITIQIWDFNHNSYETFLLLPFETLPNNSFNTMVYFRNPITLDLNNGLLQEMMYEVLSNDSSMILTQLSMFYKEIKSYATPFDIISGSQGSVVLGDVKLLPQYKRVGVLSNFYLSVNPLSYNQTNYFPTETTIINPLVTYMGYQPVVVEEFTCNTLQVNSGSMVNYSTTVVSNVQIVSVTICLSQGNSHFEIPLANTYGSLTDGGWTASFIIPTYVNNGTWTADLNIVTASENISVPWNVLFAKGFPSYKLYINSLIDYSPPVVLDVGLGEFNVSRRIKVRVQDSQTGVSMVSVILTPNNITTTHSQQYPTCTTTNPPGNLSPIDIYCQITLPTYYFSSYYWIYINITDYAGNSKVVGPNDLASPSLALPPAIYIPSTLGADTLPPTPLAVSATPSSVSTLPQNIQLSLHIVDDVSGVQSFSVTLVAGLRRIVVAFGSSDRSTGTALDGTYTKTIQLAASLSPNIQFSIGIEQMCDVAGNCRNYTSTYLGQVCNAPTIQINSVGSGDIVLPNITSISSSLSVVNLANVLPSTINISVVFTESIVLPPVVQLQHESLPIPVLVCQFSSANGLNYTYNCASSYYEEGGYYVHIRSFSDNNGNYNSCLKCKYIQTINTNNPRFTGDVVEPPTTGGRAYFGVANWINSTSSSIKIDDLPCAQFQFESSTLVSCVVSNGTGVRQVQGFTNGKSTNFMALPYQAPSVGSTTSVLPPGGFIAIQGSNFGNHSQLVRVMVGNLPCNISTVIDTAITCKLPAGGNGANKNVYVTVDGLPSVDGFGKFTYNDPPTTPCLDPLCSNNGQCIAGTCYCSGSWSGAVCNQMALPSTNNGGGDSPTIIITPNSTNKDITTFMAISIDSFVELDITGATMVVNNFTSWTYQQQNTSVSQNYLYFANFSSTGRAQITVLMQIFTDATNVTFAGQTSVIPQFGIKYSINITNYEWQSPLNTAQLIMRAQLDTTSQGNTFCKSINQTDIGQGSGGSDDVRWIKITQGQYALYGKFGNRAIVDGRIQIINNMITGGTLDNGGSASSSSFVAINTAHFFKTLQIDPDFSVILNVDPNSDPSQALCDKPKSWLIPVVATVGCVVAAAIGVGAFLFFKRWKRDRVLQSVLNSRSSR